MAQQEVGGFDVLVDELVVVGMLQGVSSLTHEMSDVLWGEQFRWPRWRNQSENEPSLR